MIYPISETKDFRDSLYIIPGRIYMDVMRSEEDLERFDKHLWKLKELTELFIQSYGRPTSSPALGDTSQEDFEFTADVAESNYHDLTNKETFYPNQSTLFAITEPGSFSLDDISIAVYDYSINLPLEWSESDEELFELCFSFKIRSLRSTKLTRFLELHKYSVPGKDFTAYLKELLAEYPNVVGEKASLVKNWIKEQNEGKWNMSKATLAIYSILESSGFAVNEEGIKGTVVELIHKLNGTSKDNIRKELSSQMLKRKNKHENLEEVRSLLVRLENEDLTTFLLNLH